MSAKEYRCMQVKESVVSSFKLAGEECWAPGPLERGKPEGSALKDAVPEARTGCEFSQGNRLACPSPHELSSPCCTNLPIQLLFSRLRNFIY